EAMYGVGGVAGDASSQESSSASLAYAHGNFSTAAGYIFAKNDGAGGVGTADQTQNSSVTPLFGDDPFVGSRLITHVAAQYVWNKLTANVRYSNAQWKPYASYVAFNQKENFNTGAAS